MEKFHHVQYDLKTKAEIEAEKKAMEDPKYYLRHMNNETKEALSQLDREYIAPVSNFLWIPLIIMDI